MLAEVDPGLNPLYEGCKQNRDNWEKLQEEHDKLSKFFPLSINKHFHVALLLAILESLWSESASQVQNIS